MQAAQALVRGHMFLCVRQEPTGDYVKGSMALLAVESDHLEKEVCRGGDGGGRSVGGGSRSRGEIMMPGNVSGGSGG